MCREIDRVSERLSLDQNLMRRKFDSHRRFDLRIIINQDVQQGFKVQCVELTNRSDTRGLGLPYFSSDHRQCQRSMKLRVHAHEWMLSVHRSLVGVATARCSHGNMD
jgi:hypothetical protein